MPFLNSPRIYPSEVEEETEKQQQHTYKRSVGSILSFHQFAATRPLACLFSLSFSGKSQTSCPQQGQEKKNQVHHVIIASSISSNSSSTSLSSQHLHLFLYICKTGGAVKISNKTRRAPGSTENCCARWYKCGVQSPVKPSSRWA